MRIILTRTSFHPIVQFRPRIAVLTLLLHADLHAPEHIGIRSLLLGGGQVLWVGSERPSLDAAIPHEVIDLAGARVIPGLIDGHAHLTGGGGEAGFATRVSPVPVEVFTAAGITTVIGVLGTDTVGRDAASLVATARALEEDGIQAYCHTGGYSVPPTTLTGSVRGDIVHIDRMIGVGEVAISDHRSSQPTLDEILRLASDAHVAGLIAGKAGILHLHVGDGPRGLSLIRSALDQTELPARVFNPTHVNRRRALFDEACELAKLGVTIDVTAFPVAVGEDAYSAEDALERYLDADLPRERITISSDGGGCLPVHDCQGQVESYGTAHPTSLSETLARLLGRGRSLAEVLPAFTSNVATLLRLPHVGHLAVGATADLVVLDSDGGPESVMARGAWHVRNRVQLRSARIPAWTSAPPASLPQE